MVVTTAPAQSLESYKHKCAKEVLTGWLRTLAQTAGCNNYVQALGLSWKVNRNAPTWGVYEEYPVNRSVRSYDGLVWAWDETEWCGVPTYQQLCEAGNPPEVILDIAIQHKGYIVYGFEVKHTHAVSDDKALKLRRLDVEIIEINAEWILRQVGMPSELVCCGRYGRGML